MQAQFSEQETEVELVSSLYEARMLYMAAMADQLSQMASAAGEVHIAGIFATGARAARVCVQKLGESKTLSTLK